MLSYVIVRAGGGGGGGGVSGQPTNPLARSLLNEPQFKSE